MNAKNRIIVIEDDADINDLIAYNVRKAGFAVEQVYDGRDALEKLEKGNFNIVILDIMLPGSNGFDLCRKIKSENLSSPPFVIMLSARTSSQDKLYAHILGADCYFAKPFSITRLMDTVNEVCAMQNTKFTVLH